MSNTRYIRFDSLTAMENFCKDSMFESSDADFIGREIHSLDEGISASRSAWEEGLKMYRELYDQLKEAITIELKDSRRKVSFSSNDGDDVDYDRLMAGQQEFWRTSEREATVAPTTVTIMVHTTTPGGWTPEKAMWRGLAGVVCAEILEAAGHQVEIWTVGCNNFKTRTVDHCLLKGCSDRLDISSLINALSTWYHRTVRFTSLFTVKGSKGSLPIGQLLPEDLDHITPDENRILISGITSFDSAVALVKHEFSGIEEA